MKKRRITLSVAVNVRNQCETMLLGIYSNIRTLSEYKKSEELIKKLTKQLSVLKPAIQKANEGKDGFLGILGKSNQEKIFELTVLKKKSQIINKVTDKDKKEIKKIDDKLVKQIKELENQLEYFNQRTKISIEINEELGFI